MGGEGSVTNVSDDMLLQDSINSLKSRHSQLEQALKEENSRPMPNVATVKEIKYQKLAIKDEITKLEGS